MNAPAKRYAASQDWARLQVVIMRLYLDDDKTLEEVKAYMEEHHDFFATVPMYKKKLSSWNAFKNLRLDEVLQILYLKKQRDAAHKLSLFFIRDREVDHGNLQVYLSRNPSVFAKLEAGVAPNFEAIRDVVCRTPPSSSPTLIFRRLSPLPTCQTPTVLCNRLLPASEDMFRTLHIYLDQSFDTGLWSWSDKGCWNTRGRYGPSGLLSSLLDRCITAGLSVFRQVEPVAVRRALDTPFAMLIRVFRNPPPLIVPKLLSAAAHLNRIGRGEIRGLLLQFCKDLTMAIFGREHSLARFWKSLVTIPHPDQQDAIERVLSLCISEYGTRLGPAHPSTAEAYLKYFDTVIRQKDTGDQLQSLQHQLSKVEKHFADRSLFGLLKLEHALATCKLNLEQQRLDQAEEALSRLGPGSLTARDESFRYVWLGYIQCIRGDFLTAERSYTNSVLAARRTGSRDCVLEALFQLETFFLHAKKPLEAESIRTERFRMLRKLGSLVWADQENTVQSEDTALGPTVTMIHIGSGESSATWRPSAFAETTEYAETSNLVS
ncbi:hypothetical protein F4677DRAFT_140340 [Hypoxylon crocopeplum]|nr:hypothetical protein F4677DRAFT_140340 [Hypoxylon crocopeplum]